MKKLGVLLIIFSLTIIFSACPPLLEDSVGGYGDVLALDDPDLIDPDKSEDENLKLDVYKWFQILDKIARDGKFVSLDLSKAIYDTNPPLNPRGGLIEVIVNDDAGPVTYIAFDPFPASSSGKDLIVSITLPTIAKMIKRAVDDENIDESNLQENKKYSAFRSFTNLRSVKAENVTIIGNLAFADCTALTELIFPKVGHTVTDPELTDPSVSILKSNNHRDIGKYAFLGCTGLKEIKFNSAAVIGAYAFKDCTSLSKIDFPEVWRIEENAFEGCTGLVDVFFEKVSKIGKEAFKACTGLKKAEFNVKPERHTLTDPIAGGSPCFDSVIFDSSVFTGCKALELLNIRRAWNVYFYEDVFANTGSVIEIYLYDEPTPAGSDYRIGHPQNKMILGDGTAVTLKNVEFYIPMDGVQVWQNPDDKSIAIYTQTKYPAVEVNLNKKNL
jgi:hypothetical protein